VQAIQSGEQVLESTSTPPFRGVWSLPLADVGCLVVWSIHHELPLVGWWATLRRVGELATLAHGRLRAEQALQHDALTGVLNRAGFVSRVGASHEDEAGALLLADLDGFKPVNDRHGHAVGDVVLTIVAQRVASVLRPDDVVGRFGGDEFVVFLPGADADVASRVAARVLEVLDEPITVGEVQVQLGVSVGIDTSPTRTLHEQLMVADAALYRAKNAGRGRVEVASSDFAVETLHE
jgi:diguanylate cyclase (GGDEF)-like protein